MHQQKQQLQTNYTQSFLHSEGCAVYTGQQCQACRHDWACSLLTLPALLLLLLLLPLLGCAAGHLRSWRILCME
jgi:predicted exporter